MNRPAWIAWDDLSARGECIRCGTALFAGEGDRPDTALTRHIQRHESCALDQAAQDAGVRARADIRTRLERLRLVDSGHGIALRSGDTPQSLAFLLADDRVTASADPAVKAALGRALIALSEIRGKLRIEARSPIALGLTDRQAIDRVKLYGLRPGVEPRPIPIDPPGAMRTSCVDDQIKFERHQLEMERERAKFKHEQIAIERRMQAGPTELERRIAAPAEPKPETYTVPITRPHLSHYTLTQQFLQLDGVRRDHYGTCRIVDIVMPAGLTVVQFKFNDMEFCEDVSSDTLVKHCASMLRERTFRLLTGCPFRMTVETKADVGWPAGTFDAGMSQSAIPVEIIVEVTKPQCGYCKATLPKGQYGPEPGPCDCRDARMYR